jgi:tetratricopeptide (TPR) repeat protein
MNPSVCPSCGSNQTVFKTKVAEWECQECEKRFQAPAPRDGSVQTEPDTTSKDIHPRRIFFSYGHDANRELVDRLKEDLEKRGHQVWIDYKEIGTWDNWRGKITSGIYKSQMAVAFLSIHSTRDPGVCRNEIAMALHYFGTVYPVMMENVPSESIPSTITHLQWLDFSPWKELRREPDPLAFERFYEERFLEIVSRVEGEATRFASEASVLRQVLRPSQFDAKFAQHLEGFIGRQWCFEAFESWLNQQPDSRVFLVSAGPGFGKTALAVHLANRFRGAVVGTWFCDSKSGELSDPLQAVRTLAFQLALRWDDYRTRLLPRLGLHAGSGEAQVREALETLSKKKLKDLFTLLLAEPMVDLIWREHKLVILVDGLDEATLQSEGCNELAALISGEFLELPKWVGFAVTSRPDALVSGHLQRFKPFEIAAGDVRNDEDLRTCVEQRIMEWGPLSKLPEMKRARIAGVLVAKSAGMVLYLRMVEDGLKEGALRVEQLENMESGLAGLFSHYYQSFGQRYGIAGYADSVQPLFRLLMAAPGPLPLELAGGVLGVSREEAYRLRVLLGSYAVDAQNGVALFHKTLGEWLASRSAGPFYTDAASGEEALGKWLWECFEQRRKNEHGITDPLEWETPVLDWLPKMLVAINKNEDSDALTALAGLLHERCRWDGAQALYSKALEVKKKALGPNHPNTLKSGSELGILFRDKGDYQTAETLFREVLSARDMALGPEHLDTFESRHNLGRVLQAKGDPEEAEVHFQRALIGREKLLGEAHPDTLL